MACIPPDLSLVGPDDVARGRDLIAAHAGEQRADEAIEAPHWTLQYIGVPRAAWSPSASPARS